ncbi:hypothetical protein ACEPAF_8819 [Sanghuangporus sanghuang]
MSTHYSLEVIRLEDLQWNRALHRTDPNLYVSLSIGEITERTRTVKRTRSPIWNEIITLCGEYTHFNTCSLDAPYLALLLMKPRT